jgi:hypothetical protein
MSMTKPISLRHENDRSSKPSRVVYDGTGPLPRQQATPIETDCWWDDDDEIRQSRKDDIYSHALRRG